MADKDIYHVYGYDKDADVYETIVFTPSCDCALMAAKALMHYHSNVAEICRTKTGEPYDWFVMTDGSGKTTKVFTTEYPNGIDQEKLEQEG